MSDFDREQKIWGNIDRFDNDGYADSFSEDDLTPPEIYETPAIPDLVSVDTVDTLTGRLLVEAATAVDATHTWSIMGIAGQIDRELDVDEVEFHVSSRGPVRLIDDKSFADIQDMVSVSIDPAAEGPLARQIVTFKGDSDGLALFVETLTSALDTGSENQDDAVVEWRKTDPFGILNAFVRSAVANQGD